MPIKPLEADAKAFGKLLRMGTADVQDLVRKGVVVVKPDGHIDTAQSLVAVAQHLVATRSTAEAKARAAEADAQLKERRLRAAEKREEKESFTPLRGTYSKAKAARILEALANGQSLRKAAKAESVSPTTVMRWVKQWPTFAEQYAQARAMQHQGFADEIDDALDEADKAATDPECGSQRIAAIKLRIDTRKWLLSKMLPKVYGDRTQMVIEGANPADILPRHTAEEDAAFLRMLADIQAETPPPPDRTQNDE